MLHHSLLAQESATEIKNLMLVGEGTALILFLKSVFDLYSRFKERQEQKKNSEEFIKQTIHLSAMNQHLISIKDNQMKDTQSILLGSERQQQMRRTVNEINTNVLKLVMVAGIEPHKEPETETTPLDKKK